MSIKLSDYNKSKPKIIRNIIYSDLALSFQTVPNTNDISPYVDIDAVKNSVKNLILTNHHERPFHPELGSGVTALLFDPADAFTVMNIQNEITRVIRTYERRVDKLNVSVIDQSDRNAYYISIDFSLRATGFETSVSFYLNRLR